MTETVPSAPPAAVDQPADLPTALLVIDMQRDMLGASEGELTPYRAEEILANTAAMLTRARAAGAEVIFVRHVEPDYPPMNSGHPGFEVHDAIAPLPGEPQVDKLACDAFCDTPLVELLTGRGVTHLAVCGLQTEMCVDSTSRSAVHRGLCVTLASDAHSTYAFDGAALSPDQIIAHHNKTLGGIPHPTARITVTPSAEIVFGRSAS